MASNDFITQLNAYINTNADLQGLTETIGFSSAVDSIAIADAPGDSQPISMNMDGEEKRNFNYDITIQCSSQQKAEMILYSIFSLLNDVDTNIPSGNGSYNFGNIKASKPGTPMTNGQGVYLFTMSIVAQLDIYERK